MPVRLQSDKQQSDCSNNEEFSSDNDTTSSTTDTSDYSTSSSESTSQASADSMCVDKLNKHKSKNLLDGSLSEGERFLERDLVTVPKAKVLSHGNIHNTQSQSSADEQMKIFANETNAEGQCHEQNVLNCAMDAKNVGLDSDSGGLANGENVSRTEFEKLKTQNQQLIQYITKIHRIFEDPSLMVLLGHPAKTNTVQQNIDCQTGAQVNNVQQSKVHDHSTMQSLTKHDSKIAIEISNNAEKNNNDDADDDSCSCSSHYEERPIANGKENDKKLAIKKAKQVQKSKKALKSKRKAKSSKAKADIESSSSACETTESSSSSSSSESEEYVPVKSKKQLKKTSSGSKKLIEKLKKKLKKVKSKTGHKNDRSQKKSEEIVKNSEKLSKKHARNSKEHLSTPKKKKSKRA